MKMFHFTGNAKNIIPFLFTFFFVTTLWFKSRCQNQAEIIEAFQRISENPVTLTFKNSLEINNNGGHIQGIQFIRKGDDKYYFMTGSSDSYSYVAIVKADDAPRVVSVKKLMEQPFKHAGGFQVYNNYLAVGIEDNDIKNKSVVCIYDVSNPEAFSGVPVAVLERSGEPFRSTAGCVGICTFRNEYCIAVGDWDTRHIGFYSYYPDSAEDKFSRIAEISAEELSKKGWIDQEWNPYQNINLLAFDGNEMYLIGLGHNKNSENIADLFSIYEDRPGKFLFKKLTSKTFRCTPETSFKAGAGIVYDDGKFRIISCGYNIRQQALLNLFESH